MEENLTINEQMWIQNMKTIRNKIVSNLLCFVPKPKMMMVDVNKMFTASEVGKNDSSNIWLKKKERRNVHMHSAHMDIQEWVCRGIKWNPSTKWVIKALPHHIKYAFFTFSRKPDVQPWELHVLILHCSFAHIIILRVSIIYETLSFLLLNVNVSTSCHAYFKQLSIALSISLPLSFFLSLSHSLTSISHSSFLSFFMSFCLVLTQTHICLPILHRKIPSAFLLLVLRWCSVWFYLFAHCKNIFVPISSFLLWFDPIWRDVLAHFLFLFLLIPYDVGDVEMCVCLRVTGKTAMIIYHPSTNNLHIYIYIFDAWRNQNTPRDD